MIYQRSSLIAATVAATFALASLLLVLFLPANTLLTAVDTDMISEFVSWRAYLADSLRHGHIPLWNPYTYAGQPFLGGFESAVFYPPNLIFLCLPLVPALNFSILLHLIILGWGMERWATCRNLNPWSAGLAGIVMPLSGAVFPHIYAGHLSNLSTMAWAPWIFLGLETWIWKGNRRGLFLASAAICLQILAGHIQYFFYTSVAVGIQSLVLSVVEPATRRRAIPAVIVSYMAALALGAIQLLPGLAASSEGIRQKELDYGFAAMFGFPPENFLTVIAPGFFGSVGTPVYWGRCYLWEMSLFIGAVAPLLIVIALCNPGPKRRGAILDLVIAGLLLVLALGVHTPVFDLLYRFAPGFSHFRSWSKFIFPATLFLVLITATGTDTLLCRKKVSPAIAWGGVIAGLIAAGVGTVLFCNSTGGITFFLNIVSASHESYLSPSAFTDTKFIHEAGIHAGLSLLLSGLVLVVAGVSLYFLNKQPLFCWVTPGLLLIEMIGFAAGQVTASPLSDAMPDALRQFIASHPGDYRVLNFSLPNNGFLLGAGDLGGNNPSVLRRYAEFINFTQGADPDHATQYLPFKSISPLYAMLRFRYAFVPTSTGMGIVESPTPPLPRLLLVSDEKVLAGRDAIFSAMRDASFNPQKTVLLESEANPPPQPGANGTVKLTSDSPDELIIDADIDNPALLLITDLYDHNWRAEAFPDSVQQTYHLMSADYILRAVPLTAGHHHLKIVYVPIAFPVGVGLSVVAWILWIGLFFRYGKTPASGRATHSV